MPSDAPSGAPVHMVPKPSAPSGYRFCIDYSELNKSVVVAPFPLPNIQTILESVQGACFFGKLDLRKGYWQFPVAPEDRPKLAVQVLGNVYEPPVVMMGFVESQFHVQRLNHKHFGHLEGRGLFVYLDDFFLYAATFPTLLDLLRQVLIILDSLGLRCKGDKCELGVAEIAILGHIVNADGIHMGADRKTAVDAVPFPRSCKELRRFLCMANYMRHGAFYPGLCHAGKAPIF